MKGHRRRCFEPFRLVVPPRSIKTGNETGRNGQGLELGLEFGISQVQCIDKTVNRTKEITIADVAGGSREHITSIPRRALSNTHIIYT